MVSLIIQTVLLMAIAFILGAVIGCLLRSLFGSAEAETPAVSVEASSAAPAMAAGAAGMGAVGAASLASAKTADAPATAAPKVPQPPVPTAPVKPAEKPALSVPRKPATPSTADDAKGEGSESTDGPVAASLVGGAAAIGAASSQEANPAPAPKAKSAKPAATKSSPSKAPAAKKQAAKAKVAAKPKSASAQKAPVGAAAVPDNLKEIRGIGPQNEGRLNNLGVNSFAQIASWKRKDEAYYGEALSFPGRIEREDWVGQAKVLAKGGKTDFSKRVASGSVSSSLGKADAGTMGSKPKNLLTAPRDGMADNLTLIDGVGNAIEKKMFKLGIYHFDQVAKMSKAELAWLGNSVGFPGRPERENWAGESKVLAEGGTTDHAQRVEKGQINTSRKSTKNEK
ncbi:MAG: hypothetical protein AAFQ10_07275 [Pseudomonadota bacterium]